jgi:hypothetical protein
VYVASRAFCGPKFRIAKNSHISRSLQALVPFQHFFKAAAPAASEARAGSVSPKITESKVNEATKALGECGRAMALTLEVKAEYWARTSYD